MKKLSKTQTSLLQEMIDNNKTVVLLYGTTFVVSGRAYRAERSTVVSLVRRGFLAHRIGILETYGVTRKGVEYMK